MNELEKSKSGSITLKYNGKYIHSKYDPVKEAKQFVDNNEHLLKKDKVLVYGIGLGYHLDEILKRSNAVIYVFEWNKELINYCKEINYDIFEENNIKIIDKNNRCFYTILSKVLNETKDILIHRASLETIKYENEQLYNLFNDFSIKKQLITINKSSSQKYEENYNFHMQNQYASIDEFIANVKNKQKTIVITAAGPSLEDELDILKKSRDKFIIFTVGSAMRTVIESGIYPDAVFIIDGAEEIKNQLIGFENFDISLCFSAFASKEAIKIYNGPKYIFNNNEDKERLQIITGGSVAVAALDIAIKCKPEEIVFLGQDLALINGKNHTKCYEKMHLDKKESQYKLIEVPGVDGGKVKTIQSYILFKNSIERIINFNRGINFVNCSKGILIKGTKNMNFKLYLDKEFK